MSVYKRPDQETYSYDFQVRGHRVSGNTEARNRKDAEAVERGLKAKAKADVEAERRTGNGPLLLRHAAGRYWQEVGERHVNSAATYRDLQRLIKFFGPDKRLDAITDGDVAGLVTARRKDMAKRNGKTIPVGPATINRTTIVPLKALFMRAKRTWRYSFPLEPVWRDHWQKQPEERVRELDTHEAKALDAAVRDDYAAWFRFSRLTGLRRAETLIRWADVNWSAKLITTVGKRDRPVITPITEPVAAILAECKGHHEEYVFTYIRRQPGEGKGERFPITPGGAKTHWRRLRAKSGVENFRFHDIRHDVATKLLRETGNLKIVQKALNHANIATTTKYAHVQTAEVAAALEAVAARANSHEKSHEQKIKAG